MRFSPIRLFLDRYDSRSPEDLSRLVTTASLSLALFLVLLKAVGSAMTDSLGLLSSLIDSATDVAASLGTFIGVRAALRPADSCHRYGHGKAEAMAALGTTAFIFGSAFFLLIQGVHRLFVPGEIHHGYWGAGIMAVSMLLTYGLVRLQGYVLDRTNSSAIAADQVHYLADFIANGATIVAILVSYLTGYGRIDAVFGLLVALWLIGKAVPIARDAINVLMDRELSEDMRRQIMAFALAHPDVQDVHDLRSRRSGQVIFIEMHLELDGDMPLHRVHAAGERIEAAICHAWPEADVILHFDPAGVDEPRLDDEIAEQS